MKLKAGTLFYAVFIAFLILSVVSAFMVYSFHHTRILQDHDRQLTDLVNLRSAIELALSKSSADHDFRSDIVLFEEDPLSELRVEKRKWGLYDLLTASTLHSGRSQFRACIVGSDALQRNPISLYLADLNKPLSLAGNTEIKGACILPESGLRRAYIEGRGFSGQAPSVNGKKPSDDNLPPLSKSRIDLMKKLLQGEFGEDSLIDGSVIGMDSSFHNSWENNCAIAYAGSKLVLQGLKLTGQFIVFSTEEIDIRNCTFDGVICVSPVIRVNKQVKGNIQLVASDSIVISGRSHLNYPSSVCLVDMDKTKQNKPGVVLKGGSKVEGDIIMASDHSRYRNEIKLGISENSGVTGCVYVNGQVEHRGQISGTLYCRSFVLNTPTSIYANHLLDATIDRTQLPVNFLSSLVLGDGKKQLVKWLN